MHSNTNAFYLMVNKLYFLYLSDTSLMNCVAKQYLLKEEESLISYIGSNSLRQHSFFSFTKHLQNAHNCTDKQINKDGRMVADHKL